MRTTIKMIAERAGVSIGTVDRVLHDRPYVKVEVRERVLRVMEELDYHPNRMASALATSGTPRKLALVQPEWEEGFVRDEMYLQEFHLTMTGIQRLQCVAGHPELPVGGRGGMSAFAE